MEYLKTIEQGKFVSLVALVSVKAGKYKLRAMASLKLAEIVGLKPSEVWELFDKQVDKQIKYYEKRDGHVEP